MGCSVELAAKYTGLEWGPRAPDLPGAIYVMCAPHDGGLRFVRGYLG